MVKKSISNNKSSRRKFIDTGLSVTAGATLLSVPGLSKANVFLSNQKDYTVQQVIDLVLKEIPNADLKNTVDTIKAGSKDAKVTGIVTTMFSTIEVIKQTIQLNANFIIAHEPTFYNHNDNLGWVVENEVTQKKLALLNQHNITVWRSHDSWHAIKPDGIIYGVIKKIGWLSHYQNDGTILNIPEAPLKNIIKHFKQKLDIKALKVIGDANQPCKKIALLPGAWGGKLQIETIIKEKPDVIIVGEVSEWETAEYVRDARLLGINLSLIILGHAFSEEPGMEWMAEWLQPKLPGIAVTHIASREPFNWV